VKLAEGKPIIVPSLIDNDFKTNPLDIKNSISTKTKMIIFSSPCNPSGTVYTKEELYNIVKILEDYPNIYVVSDEIYEHINFTRNHFSIGTIPSIKDRTITVNGVSKGFAMTGWRVGFIGAPLSIAKACTKIQGQITSATCAIAQKATETAMLENPKEVTKEMCKCYIKRRDLVLKELVKIPGIITNIPQGAFYIFPDISYYFGKSDGKIVINNADDLCMYLLNHAHVALVSGSAFGQNNCIRISYATSEKKLLEACRRLKKQLSQLS